MKALFLIGNPMPLKYALNQAGFNVGAPRLPLTEPDEATAAKIRERHRLAVSGHKRKRRRRLADLCRARARDE